MDGVNAAIDRDRRRPPICCSMSTYNCSCSNIARASAAEDGGLDITWEARDISLTFQARTGTGGTGGMSSNAKGDFALEG